MAIGSIETFEFEQGIDGFSGFSDTTIFSELENAAGGTEGVFSGTTKLLRHRRVLLRVDLAEIPSDAIVTEVSLTMTVDRSGENFGAFDLNLHRLTRAWGEGSAVGIDAGGAGGTPAPGDATWLMARFGQESWSTPGGDFIAAPRATASAARSGSLAVWSSEGMVQDVQDWIATPSDNHGWIIVSALEGEQQRVKRFFSSEAAGGRPVLKVVAIVPDPEMPWGGSYGLVSLFGFMIFTGLALCAGECHSPAMCFATIRKSWRGKPWHC